MLNQRFGKWLPWISTPLILVVFFLAWDLFVQVSGISELVLPRPWTVLSSLADIVRDPETWTHARITAVETISGFLIALVVGVAVAPCWARSDGSSGACAP